MSPARMAAMHRARPVAASLVALGLTVGLLASPVSSAAADAVALVGGRIHTAGPAGTIEGGTVLIENGRIVAVGRDVTVPAGHRRIDLKGRAVTPGLIDSSSQIGVHEVGQVTGTRDDASRDPLVAAAFTVADAINPRSTLIPVARVEGVTRVVVAPSGGASLVTGQGVLMHLGARPGHERLEDLLVRSPIGMYVTLGEGGAAVARGGRGVALGRLREMLEDARDFGANRATWMTGDRRAYTPGRLDLEAWQPVLRGELPLVVSVSRASDIEAVLRLAAEQKIRLILSGAAEAWRVAPALAAAGVPVVIDPLFNRPASFETLGATLENAARLARAGVTIAFTTFESHNVRNIRQAAGNAVAHGLPWEAALRAMTSTPARVWGVDSTCGSLEPGKDADVVVWDGDPLELSTSAEHVFIRGIEMPKTTRQTELRDRYMNPALLPDAPAADRP